MSPATLSAREFRNLTDLKMAGDVEIRNNINSALFQTENQIVELIHPHRIKFRGTPPSRLTM